MQVSSTSAFQPRRRVAKGQARPRYLQSGDIDKVMLMLVNLLAEVSALRDRIDSIEAVSGQGETPTTAAIEGYRITPERHIARESARQAMLSRVLRPITEEREAAERTTS
jgi:hypothetical protein